MVVRCWRSGVCSVGIIYSIEATINPKILSGITDYITAANQNDIDVAIQNYITEANKISDLLGRLDLYKLKRIDYCVNFYLPELGIGCSRTQIMELIKRGNVPKYYNERKYYSDKYHRKVSPDDSFYLKSNSVVINCYDKYSQMEKKYPDNPCFSDSHNVIRFEIQCKYTKVYNMAKKLTNTDNISNFRLLNDDITKEVIDKYYKRIIRVGDYYTLADVIHQIKIRKFRKPKEDRLIDTLKRINRCRGISKAKSELQENKVDEFNQSLRELSYIGINPVTIPREWNVKYIPNLIHEYYNIVGESQGMMSEEFRDYETMDSLYKKLKKCK